MGNRCPKKEDREFDSLNRNKNSYVALNDFTKRSDAEINIKKHDKLLVRDRSNPEWFMVYNLRSKKTGYVPTRYIASIDSLEVNEWFFTSLSRIDAELLLEYFTNEVGTFLVRNSESNPNKIALSVLDVSSTKNRQAKHYLIHKNYENMFYINQTKTFKTLCELIQYYTESNHGLCCKLIKSCPKLDDVPGVHGIWEEDRKNIEIKEKIGSGVTGDVYKGIWRKNYTVAVKVVRTSQNSFITRDSMLNEAEKMKKLRHKHILRLWCVCTIGEPIYIVTQYMLNGSLLEYLRNDKGRFIKFKAMISMATQIAAGMKYLEDNKYVHCDLAARNILVGERNLMKVSDFGFTQKLNESNEALIPYDDNHKLPVKWTAPEVFTVINNYRIYTVKADVWSFGVLLYELVTYGAQPYPDLQPKEVMNRVREEEYRMPRPEGPCTEAFYGIMKSCWNSDPLSRPTFERLHDLFENYFINMEPQYKDPEDF